MTDKGKRLIVSGIKVVDNDDRSVTMRHWRHINDIFKRFGMDD